MPIGLMSIIDGCDPETLRAYYRKWYRPDNQAVIVVGDVDVDHIEAQIKKLFSGIKVPANAAKVIPELVPDNDTAIYVVDKDKYSRIYEAYDSMGIFEHIIGTSALNQINVGELLSMLEGMVDDGPMYFPEDMITDHPERFIVSEIIREKLLLYLKDEVPHGVAVEIESYEEEGRLTRIGAVIYCEKKSHKGIIIGKVG